MSKELKEAKRICRLLCGKRNKNGKREYKTFARMQMQLDYSIDEMAESIETVLQALKNSIPKEVIKKKVTELDKECKEILSDYGNIDTDVVINIPNQNVRKHYDKIVEKIIILQELLEENKNG